MRLIDAEALKEKLDELEPYIDCDENSTTWILSDEVYNAVDNSQTVELDESVIQKVLNPRCMTVITNEYLIELITSNGKRPKGEWLWLGDNPNPEHKWSCNKCGRGVKEPENFCPNCGLKMQKGGMEND